MKHIKVKKFGPGFNHKLIIENLGRAPVGGPVMTAYSLKSYDSIIALAIHRPGCSPNNFYSLSLDAKTWDYSKTTAKHRNAFMDQFTPWACNDTNTTTKRISTGDILLENLND
tara:strand:- start:586 stop:924 length:339 start_codon:yes stop_codon:yes gene_type:complete